MYLRTANAIVKVPERKILKSVFCKHSTVLKGYMCSEHGFERISGDDYYEICAECGKILKEYHTDY